MFVKPVSYIIVRVDKILIDIKLYALLNSIREDIINELQEGNNMQLKIMGLETVNATKT